ncbi:SRPBCC domain-containing protein [Fulvivirgaceae bacterium PWU5]|uniref:SRPBCC domain-containing protein n=1 Tax=Dawidia cretensis TaxID=2782350 RepID=A0AAP2E2X2_9BACT|nr:SRPBCC domain-containing protein [Dawidia cretensis]MBT1711730.1 SRPBCC domain-containing protein [Dawidia cretensis]
METAQPFVIERTYNAPVEKVWKAITDKDQMKEWYFDLEEFIPEVGFEFTFAGKGHKGEQYIHRCKILEVIPQKKLTHTWTYENHPGYSTVTFELFSEGTQTRVKLTHAGLESFPQNNPDFAKESFAGGWTELVGKLLRQYVEK